MKNSRLWKTIVGILFIFLSGWFVWHLGLNVYDIDEIITARPTDCEDDIRFAVIGDFGDAGQPEADVAALIDS